FAVLFHSDGFDTENVDVEMGFLLERELFDTFAFSEGRMLKVRTVPEVEMMATMVCVGISQHISCYGTLGTWIEKNNLQLAGSDWKVLTKPWQPDKEDQAVIEVQIPVTRANNISAEQKNLLPPK